MKKERANAEKRFWQALSKVAIESGLEPGWEYLGYSCSRKKMNELIERFQNDPSSPGFYGIRLPLGEVNGLNLNMLIENQKELIIGIQPEDSGVPGNEATVETFRDMMISLVNTGRSWNFEAPGWIAWKTTEIRLNFRSLFNKAFQDIMLQKSDSEALYLIGEEVADILGEIREVIVKQKVEYGTVIN
ncbi:MAG: hypothetical protein D4R64_11880 [Porphyromonadaceae bacterium]|nr:MAG: hypothetical protein D4R64_11880 [Porphyromonadaceae bacterium]